MKHLQEILTFHEYFPYFLESSVILCLLFAPFHLYFSREKTFRQNRFYLLFVMFVVLIGPLLKLNVFPVMMDTSQIPIIQRISAQNVDKQINTNEINLLFIYFLGVVLLSVRLILQLSKIAIYILRSECVKLDGYKLIFGSSFPVSSFFNYILLPSEKVNPILLEHEKIHASEFHSIDKILCEIFKIVFWFHPIAYLLDRAVTINHEYICDETLSQKYTIKHYASIILQEIQVNRKNSFINHFHSFIKKRILMMSNKKIQKNLRVTLLMGASFLCVFVLFGFKKYQVYPSSSHYNVDQSDTIPEPKDLVDTIITLDPITFKENVKVVKRMAASDSETITLSDTLFKETVVDGRICKSQNIISNTFPKDYYDQNISKILVSTDTIISLDLETMKEEIKIVTNKISKLYKDLIDAELEKSSPDFELIKYWEERGAK